MSRLLGQAVCFTNVKYIRQEQIEQVRRERYTTLTGERFDRVLRIMTGLRQPPAPVKVRIYLVDNDSVSFNSI
jgi:hypothetical protein